MPLRPGIGSNHSLSVTLMGAEYSYEQRLVNKFSVISRAGAVAPEITIQNTSESLYIWYPVNLAVALEPRFYTNIDRRARLHKELDNNAADFVSIRVQYFFQTEKFTITPMYGIRRSISKHFIHEFYAGARLTINSGIVPVMNYRLAFVF